MTTTESLPPVPDFGEWVANGSFTPAALEFMNALRRHNDALETRIASLEAANAAESTALVLASGVSWNDKATTAWTTYQLISTATAMNYGLVITPARDNSKIRLVSSFMIFAGTAATSNLTVDLLVDGQTVETQTAIAGTYYDVVHHVFEYSPEGNSHTYDIQLTAAGAVRVYPGGSTYLAAQELEV